MDVNNHEWMLTDAAIASFNINVAAVESAVSSEVVEEDTEDSDHTLVDGNHVQSTFIHDGTKEISLYYSNGCRMEVTTYHPDGSIEVKYYDESGNLIRSEKK